MKIEMRASIILGITTTVFLYLLTYVLTIDSGGDFISRGLPFPFQTAVWGMGYSWRFNPLFLILDIFIWSAFWFVLIKIIGLVKRKI